MNKWLLVVGLVAGLAVFSSTANAQEGPQHHKQQMKKAEKPQKMQVERGQRMRGQRDMQRDSREMRGHRQRGPQALKRDQVRPDRPMRGPEMNRDKRGPERDGQRPMWQHRRQAPSFRPEFRPQPPRPMFHRGIGFRVEFRAKCDCHCHGHGPMIHRHGMHCHRPMPMRHCR